MAEIYLYTFTSVVIVSFLSLIGILTLSFGKIFLRKCVFILVSLAVGAMLGGAFIHLIPESFEKVGTTSAALLILLGIILFFILEKFLNWHSTHGEGHEDIPSLIKDSGNVAPIGKLVLISDGIHNLLDGIIIGASFLVSIELGIAATLAVILHEIPQEIGDFGVLIHAGFSKMRALLFNFLSALLAIVGAGIALVLGASSETLVAWVIPIAAGSFIYIAAADLIPELHKTKHPGHSLIQLIAVLVGIGAMWGLLFV